MVLADVQFRELVVSSGVEWERQAVQFYFESKVTDADSDAHAAGYLVAKRVRTSYSRQGNCDAQQASYASDGWTGVSCWKAFRWIAVELNGQLAVCDVGWWYLASNGVAWLRWMVGDEWRHWRRLAIGVEWRRWIDGVEWLRMAQEGIDVEVCLVSQPSCISAQV